MNFFFRKTNKRWKTLSIKSIEEIIDRLKNEINKDLAIKNLFEKYEVATFQSEEEQIYALVNLYINTEDFVLNNRPPVVKRNIDAKTLRQELSDRRVGKDLPPLFKAILKDGRDRYISLVFVLVDGIRSVVKKSLGKETIDKIFLDWTKKHNFIFTSNKNEDYSFIKNSLNNPTYSDIDIDLIFEELFTSIIEKLKSSIGLTYAIRDIKSVFLPLITNIDRNTSLKILNLLPKEVFANESLQFKTRQELENELSLKDESLKIQKDQSEFVSMAAHQLRTPLSGVKWTLNMIINEELGPLTNDQKAFLLKLQESNDHMIHLVNNILQADKLSTNTNDYVFEKVDFGGLVLNVTNDLKNEAKINEIKLTATTKNSKYFVLGDKEKLRNVIQNLIENSIKYTPKGGKISVSVELDEKDIVFKVSDSGIGIASSQQDKIFSRFFRASNALKMKKEGTGLGLYIVKKIVEKHLGNISFESKENEGTTFIVVLPFLDNKN